MNTVARTYTLTRKTLVLADPAKQYGPTEAPFLGVDQYCPACKLKLLVGDAACLVPVYPANEEERRKAGRGEPHTQQCILVHWRCETGDET